MKRLLGSLILLTIFGSVAAACSGDDTTLTVYSGRSEELVQPLIDRFEEETGIDVAVRYGDSAELAATILQEDSNSPADVFFAQDPASLGSVALADLFAELPDSVTSLVSPDFADDEGRWVGTSGRARTAVYDTTKVDPVTMPATEDGFVEPQWEGRVAIAPTNGSFLAFVAAKILLDGEAATLNWLEGMKANAAPTYPKNSVIVAAVDDGEVETGLVNHYYLYRRIAEEGADNVAAANYFLPGGGAGSLVMPAGAGILASSSQQDAALEFISYLLATSAQEYFATQTFEYPIVEAVPANPGLPPLDSLNPPEINLSELAAVLDRATDLVAEAGLL